MYIETSAEDIETTIMHQLQTVVIEQTDALLLIVEWTAVLDWWDVHTISMWLYLLSSLFTVLLYWL